MPYDAKAIEVMIASPGDVAQERLAATRIVHDWNTINSRDRALVLLPVMWETHASPAMGAHAQGIINRQFVRDADLLVAIFWTRLGTPTGVAASGTVEVFHEHLDAGKPAMLYFSTTPVAPQSLDLDQWRALQDFKTWARQRGLVEEYESLADFQETFRRQLAQTIIRSFPRATTETRPATSEQPATDVGKMNQDTLKGKWIPLKGKVREQWGKLTDDDLDQIQGRAEQLTGKVQERYGMAREEAQREVERWISRSGLSRPKLSADDRATLSILGPEAKELLTQASNDRHGTLLLTETFGGLSVETNGRDFVEPKKEPRIEAIWKGAVHQLAALGLLEQRDLEGEVFSVTDQGFRFADLVDASEEVG